MVITALCWLYIHSTYYANRTTDQIAQATLSDQEHAQMSKQHERSALARTWCQFCSENYRSPLAPDQTPLRWTMRTESKLHHPREKDQEKQYHRHHTKGYNNPEALCTTTPKHYERSTKLYLLLQEVSPTWHEATG